jgi:Holliday junction resolvase RusA-like endonuclease
MIELHLPYPPSKNDLRGYGKGKVYRKDKYADWLNVAGKMIMAQRVGGVPGPYKLTILAMRPDRRKRDLGNLLEATEDLLKSVGVIEDDSLSEMISMRWVTNGGPFVVRVEPAGLE